MSERNGVDPMLKVTPSCSISATASGADQVSSATAVVLEDDRHQHAVEEACLVRVGRAHEDDVGSGEPDVPDEALRRRQHRVGRVHDGLGLARRAGRVDQLHHLVGLRPHLRQLLLLGGDRAGRSRKALSNEPSPVPPTAKTCSSLGRSGRISRIMAMWSKPRHGAGTMATLASRIPA